MSNIGKQTVWGLCSLTVFFNHIKLTHNDIWLNAVGVHTELNGTSGSMLSQMLKGTPCLLRFSPCYRIVANIQSDGRGAKAQGYHSLTKKVRVVLSAISYNTELCDGKQSPKIALKPLCTIPCVRLSCFFIVFINLKIFIMDLGKEVEMLDASKEDFKEQFEFAIWSTGGSSDYMNDRERPYNGQSWTDEGERGKTEVKGLTMRDIRDCLIKAMLVSSPSNKYLNEDFSKCWDFTQEPAKPTQYLIDHQNETDFISTKVELGTWRPQDVYKINWDDVDPLAIAKNLTCEIEKMMGIFPNVPILQDASQHEA